MGIIQRQSIKGTIYSYIGVVLGFITTGLLYPFVLTADEVGLVRILVSYSILFAQFAALGFNGITVRYFPYFRDNKKGHNGFLNLGLITIIFGFIVSVLIFLSLKNYLIETSIEKSALFVIYINYIIPLLFIQLFFSFFDTYLSSLYRAVEGTILKDVVQRALIIILLLSFYFEIITFRQLVVYFVIVNAIPLIIIVFLIWKRGGLIFGNSKAILTKKFKAELLKMGSFSLFNNFTGVVIFNIDSIMINTMIGLKATGIYAISYFFGNLIKLPARSLIKISNTVLANAWKDKDYDNIKKVYYDSTIKQTIIGLLLLGILYVNVDNIFKYLPEIYNDGKYVLIFIAIGSFFEMLSGVARSVLGTSPKYYIQTVLMVILMLLVVSLNYILIPSYGINGAAISSAISVFLFNFLRFIYLWYHYKFQPYTFKHLLLLLFFLISVLITNLIPFVINIYIDGITRVIVFIIILSSAVYLLKIDTRINKLMDKYLLKIFHK